MSGTPNIHIHYEDNIEFLKRMEKSSVDLIYIDPPFNTGKNQSAYGYSYLDDMGNAEYVHSFMRQRLDQARRVLRANGSIFIHLDYRQSHRIKLLMDDLFGEDCFFNEIIWAYDYGGRGKRNWPRKHDTILWYAKDPDNYIFNADAVERIPYMAPGLVGKEKAALGKLPTDVWWHTIIGTNSSERTGYPTQKPVKLLERIVLAHSNAGDVLLDFFAGSGSFGEAAIRHERNCILVDNNKQAVEIMANRFSDRMIVNTMYGLSK